MDLKRHFHCRPSMDVMYPSILYKIIEKLLLFSGGLGEICELNDYHVIIVSIIIIVNVLIGSNNVLVYFSIVLHLILRNRHLQSFAHSFVKGHK